MLFAIEEINNNSDLLPNITLGAKIYDTCRSQTIGADRAKDLIIATLTDQKAPLAGVVGPLVSDVSIAVANLLRVFEIPQISYGSTSVDLSNKELYSNFFRTVPPDSFQAQAMVDILKYYDWEYIFTVNSFGNFGERGVAELQMAATAAKICVASQAQLPSLPDEKDFKEVIQRFLTKRSQTSNTVNVIVAFTSQPDSTDILRAARESGATQFTWIGSDGWSNRVDVTDGNEEVADGSLTVNHQDINVPRFEAHFKNMRPKGNEFNPWFQEFWEDALKCTIPGTNASSEKFLQPCRSDVSLPQGIEIAPVRVVINAVYALAHAIHNLQEVYCPEVKGICDNMQKEFQRKNLLRFLRNVTFPDASQNLTFRFNQNQEMDAVYDIKNFQMTEDSNWEYFDVGTWRAEVFPNKTERGNLEINDSTVRWGKIKGNPPSSYCSKACNRTQIRKARLLDPECCWDCVTCKMNAIIKNDTCQSCPPGHSPNGLSICSKIQADHPKWSRTPSIVFLFLSSLGLLGTTATAVFFVKRRRHPFIKASSRELCGILFVGVAMCYLAPFIYLMKPSDSVCALQRFFGNVSYTTCFAPILMKTIRIYRIFKNARSSVSRPSLTSQRSQVLITIGLISVQLLLSTLWNISDVPRAQEVYPTEGVVILECGAVDAYSLAVSLSYNSLLMLLCTIFAFKTRNFPRNFNEAKYIGVSMYLTCSKWIAFIPIYLNAPNEFWRVYLSCTALLLAGTFMLLGLLMPKVVILIFANGQSPSVNERYTTQTTQSNTPTFCVFNAAMPPTQWTSSLAILPESQHVTSDLFLATRGFDKDSQQQRMK